MYAGYQGIVSRLQIYPFILCCDGGYRTLEITFPFAGLQLLGSARKDARERLEGSGENLKATVTFRNLGTKQLLLKFARYKIVTR